MDLVCSGASADLQGVDRIEGDARCEGDLTCSLAVKGAESPRCMHGPEVVPPMQRVDFSRVQAPVIEERFKPFKPQQEDLFNMKSEHTIDKSARAGRATQIAAMVITCLVAVIWVYFGRLYLIHDPGEWRIANQQLGYPLYIIPLIGVTHILGGVGLLIPNVRRLTEWVYAGFAINLLLAFYSQLNGGGSTWDKFDPILVMAFVFASYVLRRCMRANRWSI